MARRGMRLADTVFLSMPVALLQVWLGMRCSHPGMHCRVFLGHQSFNILLLVSIIASIIGMPRLLGISAHLPADVFGTASRRLAAQLHCSRVSPPSGGLMQAKLG